MSKVRYYPKMKNPLVPIATSNATEAPSPSAEQPGAPLTGAVDPMNEFTFTIPGQTPPGTAANSPNQNVQFGKSGSGGASSSSRSRRSKRRRPPKTCVSAPAAIFIFLFGGVVFLLGVIFTSCYLAQAFPPIEYGAIFVALGAAVFCVGCVFFCWAKRAQTLHYAPTLRATRKGGGGGGSGRGEKGEYEAIEEGGGVGEGEGGGGAAAGAGGKRGSRVGFDSTPNSPESKDTDDTAIGSPTRLGDNDNTASALNAADGNKRTTTAAAAKSTAPSSTTSSSVTKAGRDSHLSGQHLMAMKNGVIQEETEDESVGEPALLSIGDEGELKSCRCKQVK